MAFISKVHNFCGDFQSLATLLPIPMWYDDTAPPGFFDNYGITVAQEYDNISTQLSRSSSRKTSLIPDRFGVAEMVVPTSPAQLISSIDPRGTDYQKVEHDEYFISTGVYDTNSWSPNYPTPTNNWETERYKASKEIEEPTSKIGRYSMEERKDKIMRYLKKRNQRNFNKTIKYECRKTLADKRIRVRGRFAKNNNEHHHHHHDGQPCEDQVLPNIITTTSAKYNSSEEDIQHLYTNNFLMKHYYDEEEEWLHEAMANLLYSPQIN